MAAGFTKKGVARMNNIDNLLNKISDATYGKEARQSIHDALLQCHNNTSELCYYKPTVSKLGILSWTPSNPNMPQIKSVNLFNYIEEYKNG